jgi:hypothetical protein
MFRLAAPGAIFAGGANTGRAAAGAGLPALRAGAAAAGFRATGFAGCAGFFFATGLDFFFFAALAIRLLSLLNGPAC